jgi:hypothetical protein
MTVNAIAFYTVAVLIVLAAAAAVGLPSLRHAALAGGALVVLLAVLDVVSTAYALGVLEVVVPGIAAGIVVVVLRRQQYRALGASLSAGSRWWIAGPVAVLCGAVLVVPLSLVGMGWYPGPGLHLLIHYAAGIAALVTVLHYRAPYALAIGVVLVVVTVAAGLVIGRRSGDEQSLDQHLQSRREREERARRRREDREQGRRRPAKEDP